MIIKGGAFNCSGGSISGDLVVVGTALDIASSVTGTTTIEVRGSSSLAENAGTGVTLKVEGDTWDGAGVLTAANGATNAGTIDLESIAGTTNSDLALLGTLTNSGTITTTNDSGGGRHILGGTLNNQGTIAAGASSPLVFAAQSGVSPTLNQQSGAINSATGSSVTFNGGTFHYTGGTLSSGLVFIGTSLDIASTVTATTTIEV